MKIKLNNEDFYIYDTIIPNHKSSINGMLAHRISLRKFVNGKMKSISIIKTLPNGETHSKYELIAILKDYLNSIHYILENREMLAVKLNKEHVIALERYNGLFDINPKDLLTELNLKYK